MEPTAEERDQREAIDFLSRPATYSLTCSPGVACVERVDTHCSIVFLAGDFAYKLKRAISYADLDYTTRERRRKACEAELVLNRRTAPDLYLAVRAIRRDASGALAFDGAGPALEHVVVMRRFAEENLFEHLAERFALERDAFAYAYVSRSSCLFSRVIHAFGSSTSGDHALTPERMIALGAAVAHLHRMAEITPEHGGAEAIRRVIAGNRRELARVQLALDGARPDGASICAAEHRVLCELARQTPLLERRRLSGKVRRCHGDLRLANIVLVAGRPLLFDCVEFSDEIACIDVLYDLAFLLMDLLLRDRSDLASLVFNAYLDQEPETDGLAALPLFLSLRAATRSYGLAGGAGRKENPRERARLLASARRHLDAAAAFLDPEPARLIALGGGACGEAGARLAVSLAGLVPPPPGARIVHIGPSAASAWEEAGAALAGGCSVLAEGAFLSQAERSRAAAVAERRGVAFVGFWLGVPGLGVPGAGLECPPWRILETGRGVLATLAGVAERGCG